MTTTQHPSTATPELPAGVHTEVAVQLGHDLYGMPFISTIKRTRRSTARLELLSGRKSLFTADEVQVIMAGVTAAVMQELIVTTGVQLALPSE